MSAAARRKITVTYSGDVEGEQDIDAAANASSPAAIQTYTLPHSDLVADAIEVETVEIDVPDGATGVTITKSGGDGSAILLSFENPSAATDGVGLHGTDPDSLSLHADTALFFLSNLSTSTDVVVRLFWS